MTAFYVVEDPDEFFADDFGNDDVPVVHKTPAAPQALKVELTG